MTLKIISTAAKVCAFGTVFALLASCAATQTAVSKRNLDVQTKMSETIFLDPVAPAQKTVYLQIRNTSGNNKLDIENRLAQAIASKGYKIVTDPKDAHYMVQTNVLQVGKTNLNDTHDALEQGFGGALLGGAAAGALGGNTRTVVGVGLLGAAANVVADAMIKDVNYMMITDLQISERTKAKVTEAMASNLKQGTSGHKTVKSTQTTDWKRYQTRVVSTANKVNLELDAAIPELVAGLSNSVAGLM